MKRTKIPTPRFLVRCHDIQFYCQEDRKAANVQFDFEVEDNEAGNSEKHRYEPDPIRLLVYSLWTDASNNVVKAHCVVRRSDKHQEDFFRKMQISGEIQCPLGRTLIADTQGFLRYGCKTKSISHTPGTSSNDYKDSYIYDSKAAAMKAILDELSSTRTLGGLNLADLGTTSDHLLQQFGYEKVPDVLKRGRSMWLGNPQLVTQAGAANLGYYQQNQERDKNIQAFLEILQKELTA